MPAQYPGNQITKEARARAGGGFESAIEASGGFTPMVAEDFSGKTAGAVNGDWISAEYSNVTAKSGSVSTMLRTNPGQAPTACGGSVDFGKRRALPSLVPVGKTVWQRFFMYLPSDFSMGYVFGGSDCAEAGECGAPCDGGRSSLKWMVLGPSVSKARSYFQPFIQRRSVQQESQAGIRVITEIGGQQARDETYPALPRDQWFAMQMAVKVSKDTGDGFVRGWINDQLVVEVVNIDTIAAEDSGIDEWGIGPYWNGIPYTDGQAGRDTFYIDEIIVASDADGYGSPLDVDSNGNAYIAPTTLVGEL